MTTTTTAPTRRHDLDWVRILAFGLLVLYHVGMYYVSWDWHVKSPRASDALEPLMLLSSPWRLALLFLVSGVATAFLLRKAAGGPFLGLRSVRLLVPLAFGMLVIVPPQSWLEVVEKLGYAGGYLDFLALYLTGYGGFCRDGECLVLPTWNHLWFVAYLWVYTVLAWAIARSPAVLDGFRAGMARALGGTRILWLPIAWLALARLLLVDTFGSTHALLDDWYNHAIYAPTFLLGLALAFDARPWVAFERARWPALLVALVAWATLTTYYAAFEIGDDVPAALRAAMRVVYATLQWLPIVAVLGFARRHLNRDSAARRYLVAAVFPVYIVHQTLIVLLAHALQGATLPLGAEGAVLVSATFGLSFAIYEVVRRIAWLRPLFGLDAETRRARSNVAARTAVERANG